MHEEGVHCDYYGQVTGEPQVGRGIVFREDINS